MPVGPSLHDATKTFLERAEALGFESLWVQEQLLGKDPSFEPIATLAYAAGLTERMTLATATIVAPLRNPVALAKQLATVDQLSGGRLLVGLSLGDVKRIYAACGVDMAHRVGRLQEAVQILRGLWSYGPTRHAGRHWAFDDVEMEPKPGRHIPIWLGGGAPAAIQRAASIADGWIGAGGSSIDDFRRQVQMLEVALEVAHRYREAFGIAKKLYVAIDDAGEAARRRLTEWFAIHWADGHRDPVSMSQEVGVAGTADEVASCIKEVIEAGADTVILNFVFDEREQLERLAALARDLELIS